MSEDVRLQAKFLSEKDVTVEEADMLVRILGDMTRSVSSGGSVIHRYSVKKREVYDRY